MISSLTWEPKVTSFTSTTREQCGDGGGLDLPVECERNAATAADGALSLAREAGWGERAGDRGGVIRKHEVEGASEKGRWWGSAR